MILVMPHAPMPFLIADLPQHSVAEERW